MGKYAVILLLGWITVARAMFPSRMLLNATSAEVPTSSDQGESQESRDSLPERANLALPGHRRYAATDQNGRPVPSMTASLTVSKGGPMLLQDVNYISQLAHFDRERIPERVVHARGAGAHGHFTVTHDEITNYTRASLFAGIGKRTPLFVRFSTVTFESGSSDTLRDPRGFAVKFYTEQGNWDLVGNNMQIFPIRDPLLFPSLIHSRKRNPTSHLPDLNTFWDFNSLRPETTHHTLQLFSDLGIPDGFRFMDGAGVHTFKLVNSGGSPVYCKFHWKSNQGVRNLTVERATELAGTDPDYGTEDLFNAIAAGNFPSWKLYVQIMKFKQASVQAFNPFDITKIWPEDSFPLIPVGEMVLDRNPVDYFTETEMAAFDPGSMVPGIEFSPDPMLIGRSFSYMDAQRYRLGANFLQLPINKPKNKVNTYQRDGAMALDNGSGGPNYFPNSFQGPQISKSGPETAFKLSGDVVRMDTVNDDNFSQATDFLKKLNLAERGRLVRNLADSLKGVNNPEILKRSIENFKKVEEAFGEETSTEVQKMIEKSKKPLGEKVQ